MDNQLDLQPVSQKIEEAKRVLILVPANPSLDSLASGLALYLSLKKQGKNTGIACPTDLPPTFKHLPAVDKLSKSIGSRNLVISFDYLKDSIEKVSYNIEDNKFNLVVEPKSSQPPLDPDKVSYSYTGANADLLFVIGARQLENLGKFYSQEKNIFTDKFTINIDNKGNNAQFGQANLLNSQAASCAEIVIEVIKGLGLPVDPDIATNLYTALQANTSNFQAANVDVSTFEAAAWCLKNQARRSKAGLKPPVTFPQKQLPEQQGSLVPGKQLLQPKKPLVQSVAPPFTSPKQVVQKPPFSQQSVPPENKEAKPPPDWFKPKIYSGDSPVRK